MSASFHIADGHTLGEVLEALCGDGEVFASRPGADGQVHLVRSRGWKTELELGNFRAVEPIKSLFFRPREFVGFVGRAAPAGEAKEHAETKAPRRFAVGVKNCDLASLTVHDHVFRDSKPVDPAYADARATTAIVSADCTDCLEVCFCTAVGQQPHPRAGFDINVSPVRGDGPLQYVLEAGSPRGTALLGRVEHLLEPADAPLLRRRDAQREAMAKRVATQAAAAGLTADLDFQRAIRTSDDALWREFAARCVECGACNFVCCTCHCFLLADGVTADGQPARTKQWDACLFLNFARVAGGNPRPQRAARLRNRFEKKFDFFKDRIGQYACDGCGRCTEVCTANIDIREVLRRAVAASPPEGGAG